MKPNGEPMTVIGLFAGIGGIEQGLRGCGGYHTELLCEIDPGAQRVLKTHFNGIPIKPDVRGIKSLPKVDLVVAGFPCQDLSQAGRTVGIKGNQSSLVAEVFRLLRRESNPRWLLLENVPFMLQLQRGKAMRYLVDELEELGFTWAYRVVDARAFGIPQRRQRVLLVASRTEDPRPMLFGCDAGECLPVFSGEQLCGFYWTEGLRGLRWAVDAVPTLKGGSTIGIPSPPGVWDPLDHSITTPDIRDVERLQGFAEDWTVPALADDDVKRGHRWKLVGNAVSVPMGQWIGKRIAHPTGDAPKGTLLKRGMAWPRAAWGGDQKVYAVDVSAWPVREPSTSLRDFLPFPRAPLSYRAAAGFYSRADASCLKFEEAFLQDVKLHVDGMAMSVAPSHGAKAPEKEEQPACA
jgi:DNA (cytosine-5)-methyltransferase 1